MYFTTLGNLPKWVFLVFHFRHDDVIKWKHFPRYWPFVRGIHRSPVNSPYKGQWRGALMFTLICARINGWVNNREAGDLRRYRGLYDVTVMVDARNKTYLILQHILWWKLDEEAASVMRRYNLISTTTFTAHWPPWGIFIIRQRYDHGNFCRQKRAMKPKVKLQDNHYLNKHKHFQDNFSGVSFKPNQVTLCCVARNSAASDCSFQL